MIARKSALILEFDIISALLAYIGLFFVARFMGAHALGIVGFGFAYVLMFYFIGDLGFGMAHVKRISEGKDIATCIGTFARIKLVLITIMACSTLASILIWKFVFGRGFESSTHEFLLYIMIFYPVFLELSNFFRYTFLARKETAKYVFPAFLENVSRVVVIILVVILGFGVLAIACTYIFGMIIMFFACLLLFRNYPIGKYDKTYFKSYLSFALPGFLVTAITAISVQTDKVMLQLFWSATEVGYYFGVHKLTDFGIILSTAVSILLFPTISSYHAENRIKEISVLTRKVERYNSLVISPIVIFIIALAPQIIRVILSAEFLPAVLVLQTLALYVWMVSVNNPYMLQFGAIGRVKLSAKIATMIALLNISLNLIFIPTGIFGIKLLGLGAFGAALTTVISCFAGVVVSRIYTKRLTNTVTNLKIFIHLLVACLTGFLFYLLGQIIPLDRWFSLICAGLFYLAFYLFVLYCLKEFTKEDYHFFLDTLNIKKTFEYMKGELKG